MNGKKQAGGTNLRLKNRFIIFSVTLFGMILIAGSVAFVSSMQQIIRTNKGNELSQMLEIERIRLETSVNSEIAIVLKLADSPLMQRYFSNPGDPRLEQEAFEEMASYRRALSAQSIFWINDIDRLFYIDDTEPYWLDANSRVNYWYNMTLHETEVYNFNINYNPDLNVTNLWINAPVFNDDKKPIGMVGTGIELNGFIDAIYEHIGERIDLYFFNEGGEISGAVDINLVVDKVLIADIFPDIDIDILSEAGILLPGNTQAFNVSNGKIAIGTIPSLEWYSIAFMEDSIADYETAMTVLFLVVLAVILLIFLLFNIVIAIYHRSILGIMESLEYAKSEAEEASRSKSNFLAMMSHEIRTPLNAIIGVAQIELQKKELLKETTDSLEKINSSGTSLLGIINDILDLSKIETGRLELNPVEYDTPSLINDSVQLNIVRIGSKKIEFKLEVDPNLPVMLYGDELRLKQILNNILSNAFKYTEEGYVKLSVSHKADGEEVILIFAVEDTGQGMKPEDKNRLFSEYLRFNAEANRITEGTGLGLSITKKLADMMNGSIEVESEYGKGSTFTVKVRQKAVKCGVIGPEVAERLHSFKFAGDRQAARLQITRKPMPYGSILLVDDVEINLFVAEGLLTLYSLKIDMAESGFAAIDKINSGQTYDIIFMDHMMPKMDGIETTRKMRAFGYKGVIVALTANALAGNEEMFLQNGFDGFISKPIDIYELDMILGKFVRDRHPEEAEKYESETTAQIQTAEKDPKLMRIFRRDAEKAIKTLRETVLNGDIKLFTTTVHAMKSALANVGEGVASEQAYELEKAGSREDTELIAAKAEAFIETLEALIKSTESVVKTSEEVLGVTENTEYLTEQLQIVKAACEAYDDAAVYDVLNQLLIENWTPETTTVLESIRDALFLHSDFDGAAAIIGNLLNE